MIARLPNGHLLVPEASYDPDLGIDADGYVEIGPDHPEFELYAKDLERYEKAFGRPLTARPNGER